MNDPRKVVGTHVQALATRVISDQECQRRYDKNWKVKKLDGIVDLFEYEWDPIHNRRRGMVTATFQYGSHGRTRTVKLCLQSVKLPVNAEPGIGIVNANNEVVDPHLENAEAADQQVNIPRLVMFANAEPEMNNPAAQRLVFPEEGIDPDEANTRECRQPKSESPIQIRITSGINPSQEPQTPMLRPVLSYKYLEYYFMRDAAHSNDFVKSTKKRSGIDTCC